MTKELIIVKLICLAGAAISLVLVFQPAIGIALNRKVLNLKIKTAGFEGTIKPGKKAKKIVKVQAVLIVISLVLLAIIIKF